jgi:hypothetical protein
MVTFEVELELELEGDGTACRRDPLQEFDKMERIPPKDA